MVKNLLWVLLGVLIGVGGFYFATKPWSNAVQPTSAINVSMMFKQALDTNDLEAVRELMTPQQKNTFTATDLQSVRKYIGVGKKAEGGSSYDNYEVLTFGTNKAVTLWLVPPIGKNHMWQIQKVTEGATVTKSR